MAHKEMPGMTEMVADAARAMPRPVAKGATFWAPDERVAEWESLGWAHRKVKLTKAEKAEFAEAAAEEAAEHPRKKRETEKV